MDNTSSRAGLMSGIAMAIYGSVPADDDGELTRDSTRLRALRHEKHRETLRRLTTREPVYETHRRATRQRLDD